jgi:hypothetical protein
VEIAVIGIIRVLGSLPVLRWAFAGGVIAILVDFSDLFLKNLLDLGGLHDYQLFDKVVDQVYMALFLWVALGWVGPARTIALGLYGLRLAGLGLYLLVDERWVLLAFPNVFEFWYLFVASTPHWWRSFRCTPGQAAFALAPLTAVKLFQEYVLHYGRWLDDFTAIEAVEAIWSWATAPIT